MTGFAMRKQALALLTSLHINLHTDIGLDYVVFSVRSSVGYWPTAETAIVSEV